MILSSSGGVHYRNVTPAITATLQKFFMMLILRRCEYYSGGRECLLSDATGLGRNSSRSQSKMLCHWEGPGLKDLGLLKAGPVP
jgi:hypothetical protein